MTFLIFCSESFLTILNYRPPHGASQSIPQNMNSSSAQTPINLSDPYLAPYYPLTFSRGLKGVTFDPNSPLCFLRSSAISSSVATGSRGQGGFDHLVIFEPSLDTLPTLGYNEIIARMLQLSE